jgi:molybdenum cofactor synthesis domain-containing protein
MSETSQSAGEGVVTAALMVIGDEILSGRTKDKNIGHVADHLTAIGIQMKEVRIVPDEEPEIVAALNALRKRYDYVFTTGGIGPTHDDITADAVAKAFAVGIDVDERALAPMRAHFQRRGVELTPARMRMARIPFGAELVENSISIAPGFMLGNVIVMAGIPSIMHVMLDAATKYLKTG